MKTEAKIQKLIRDIQDLEASKKYVHNEVSVIALDHSIKDKKQKIKMLRG